MATFTDTFDGVINTPLVGRTGWVALNGSEDVLLLNGSGAVKDTGGGYEKSAGHDTGSQDHYVKAIVGAGFVAQTDATVILVIAASVGGSYWGIGYRSTTNLMRLRGYGGYEEVIAGGALVAGDELELTWKYSTGLLTIKRNGTTEGTKTWGSSPGTGTHTGVMLIGSRAAQDDVFRSWESGELLAEGVPDTTPPTLTLPTVTATGTTTVTGGITTNDAGPAWAVLTTSASKPTAAQIKAGQNHTGVASPAATATLVVGANAGVFAFSGLAPTTGYFLHVVQDDTTVPANTSTVATSASVTTDTTLYPIITLPVLKNNTGTLLTSVTGATVHVYATATGNKVVTKTGQTSNASAVMAITDPALVAGTEYRCVIVLASGAEGLQKATAA